MCVYVCESCLGKRVEGSGLLVRHNEQTLMSGPQNVVYFVQFSCEACGSLWCAPAFFPPELDYNPQKNE